MDLCGNWTSALTLNCSKRLRFKWNWDTFTVFLLHRVFPGSPSLSGSCCCLECKLKGIWSTWWQWVRFVLEPSCSLSRSAPLWRKSWRTFPSVTQPVSLVYFNQSHYKGFCGVNSGSDSDQWYTRLFIWWIKTEHLKKEKTGNLELELKNYKPKTVAKWKIMFISSSRGFQNLS